MDGRKRRRGNVGGGHGYTSDAEWKAQVGFT